MTPHSLFASPFSFDIDPYAPPLQGSEDHTAVLITALGPDAVTVRQCIFREKLSTLFEGMIEVQSRHTFLEMQALLGSVAHLHLHVYTSTRSFSGIITHMFQRGNVNISGWSYYCLTIRPHMYAMALDQDYRIFQNVSPLSMVQTLLDEHGIVKTQNHHQRLGLDTREYCVQYQESSFDFVDRILAEEGLFYTFTHSYEISSATIADTLHIMDHTSQLNMFHVGSLSFQDKNAMSSTTPALLNFEKHTHMLAQAIALCDYNFLTPQTRLFPKAPVSARPSSAHGQHMTYPGYFRTFDEAERYKDLRAELSAYGGEFYQGESTHVLLHAGAQWALENHPIDSYQNTYCVDMIKHHFLAPSLCPRDRHFYYNRFTCFEKYTPFRPPLKSKPSIASQQTAHVVGPKGEEIFTDKYGRIKVQFHWDQRGQKNDKSTCWIRVLQGLSGAQFGQTLLPRVGMEVIVGFLNGDPDRPVVLGCVPNGTNTPPLPLPENQYTTAFKTQSFYSKEPRYHAFYIRDTAHQEELRLRAQKDLAVDVIDGDYITVIDRGTKRVHIKKGNLDIQIDEGHLHITAAQSLTVTTQSSASIHAKGDLSLSSDANIAMRAQGRLSFSSNQGMTLSSLQTLSLESTEDFAAKSSGQVSIQAGGKAHISSKSGLEMEATDKISVTTPSEMTLQAGGPLKLKGNPVDKQ